MTDFTTNATIVNATVSVQSETVEFNPDSSETTDENGQVTFCLYDGISYAVNISHPDYDDIINETIDITSSTGDTGVQYMMNRTGIHSNGNTFQTKKLLVRNY